MTKKVGLKASNRTYIQMWGENCLKNGILICTFKGKSLLKIFSKTDRNLVTARPVRKELGDLYEENS